jgi:hypothetical protein
MHHRRKSTCEAHQHTEAECKHLALRARNRPEWTHSSDSQSHLRPIRRRVHPRSSKGTVRGMHVWHPPTTSVALAAGHRNGRRDSRWESRQRAANEATARRPLRGVYRRLGIRGSSDKLNCNMGHSSHHGAMNRVFLRWRRSSIDRDR